MAQDVILVETRHSEIVSAQANEPDRANCHRDSVTVVIVRVPDVVIREVDIWPFGNVVVCLWLVCGKNHGSDKSYRNHLGNEHSACITDAGICLTSYVPRGGSSTSG